MAPAPLSDSKWIPLRGLPKRKPGGKVQDLGGEDRSPQSTLHDNAELRHRGLTALISSPKSQLHVFSKDKEDISHV